MSVGWRRFAALGSAYQYLASLMGKKVRTDVIREHWGDILRLVASLNAGHVAPSTMLRKLAAYERQNQLDLALQEIGKVERTLFMLTGWRTPTCAGAVTPASTKASSATP